LAALLLLTAASVAQNTVRAQFAIKRNVAGKGNQANVVVWLTPINPSDPLPARPTQRYRLVQKNKQFEPHLLVLPVGSAVDFPNQDPFFHNVFSLYKGKRFDLGLYEAGESRSVHFDKPGISFIFCNIHPEMSAVVMAMSTPLYDISNPAGEVSIQNVPAGRYRVEFWYERSSNEALQALAHEITVSGDTTLGNVVIPETIEGPLQHKNKFGKDYDKTGPNYEPK
jgi:plastocyanin